VPHAHRLTPPGDDDDVGQAVQDLAVADAKGRVVVAADTGTDGAGPLALRLVGQPQAVARQLLVQLPDGDAGLDRDGHVVRVDLQDLVHTLGFDHDAALPGHHAAAHARASGEGYHRQPVRARYLHDLEYLVGVLRCDDNVGQIGHVFVAGAPVAAVGHAVYPAACRPFTQERLQLLQRWSQHLVFHIPSCWLMDATILSLGPLAVAQSRPAQKRQKRLIRPA